MGRGKGGSNGGGRSAGNAQQSQNKTQKSNKKKDEMAGVCFLRSIETAT